MEQTGNIAAMHEDRKDGHSNGDAPDPRLPGEKDDKQHGIGRGGQNGAERDIVRRKDDDQKQAEADDKDAPVHHDRQCSARQDALAAAEAVKDRENMTQLRHRACDHHPELRVSGQEPAAEQAGEHDLTHIHQDDEQRCPAAEVPQKIRQAGVSAAFFADVVVHAGVRHDDCAVAAAEQVARSGTADDAPPVHAQSSLSPFWRMVSRMGVPSRPKTPRS